MMFCRTKLSGTRDEESVYVAIVADIMKEGESQKYTGRTHKYMAVRRRSAIC